MLWIVKFIETDYRMVVTRGQGEMGMGCYCLMDSEFESEKATVFCSEISNVFLFHLEEKPLQSLNFLEVDQILIY